MGGGGAGDKGGGKKREGEPEDDGFVPMPARPDHADLARIAMHAGDAAAFAGPVTDSEFLPRESMSGFFLRNQMLESKGGGRQLGEAEAARLAIEKHVLAAPGTSYDPVIEKQGEDAFIVKLHRLDPNPPFLPDLDAAATYRIDRSSGEVRKIG